MGIKLANDYFFCFDKITYVQGAKSKKCILCSIIKNEEDVVNLEVYQDDFFVISVNLYPYNPGHLILFPKRHLIDIREYTSQEEKRLLFLQKECINILEKLYSPGGFNIGYNMGSPAGASIQHLHLHIIPRYPREIGIADLIGGKKVLVENPIQTRDRIKEAANYLSNL